MRATKREYYLNIAKAVAQRSTCLRRQYGAVIVKDDVIIATGYNGSARGDENCCDVGVCSARAAVRKMPRRPCRGQRDHQRQRAGYDRLNALSCRV